MMGQARGRAPRAWLLGQLKFGMMVVLAAAVSAWSPARAEDDWFKTAGGISAYIGVVPAEIVKGPPPHSAERPMHGGAPRGRHEYHVVAALYDAVSNARIVDATVTAQASGIGLSGSEKTLEPMKIAETVTYGGYFNLPADLYTIRLTVSRPGAQAVVLDFKFDHRRR